MTLGRTAFLATTTLVVAVAVLLTGAWGPVTGDGAAEDPDTVVAAGAVGPVPELPGLVPVTAPRPTPLPEPPLRAPSPAPAALPSRDEPTARPPLPTSTSPEGWTVAGGSSRDPLDGGGPTITWTLEVEPGTGLDLRDVLEAAEGALYDARSWARDHDLRRVADPDDARVRVLVASPSTVDRLCAAAGLYTESRYSCWNGTFAALNLDRWRGATPEFDDLAVYRGYLVNHEVGHALGFGHVRCDAPGALADVMQQQSIALAGCRANAWPYPDG